MTVIDNEVVAALGRELCQRIGEPRYLLWFQDKTKFSQEDDRLIVGVPNRFFQEWLERTFLADIRETASALAGRPLRIAFTIDPQLFQAFRNKEVVAPDVGHEAEPMRPASVLKTSPTPAKKHARRWRRLQQFVVGPCNRVAHAAALALVEAPGQGPNPLVLHGPVGIGKSHLLEGIYVGLRHEQPDARILYLTAEDFTNRFLNAMHQGKLSGFRKHFREADALLVDDIDFFAKKRATQEEFLHTFDALLQAERPVAVTCDCHPRLSDQFLPELTDRLLGGAIWPLNLPEQETRLALLSAKRRAGQREPLPDAVLAYLAEHLRGNVRELEGALNTLDHVAKVTAQPITVELAREALAAVLRHSIRVVQLEDVERAASTTLGLDKGALRGGQRGWMFSHPRMLAVYLARKHTAASYTEIGRYFGGRSHSTAVAAEKKVRQWLSEDSTLSLGQRHLRARDTLEMIERELLR